MKIKKGDKVIVQLGKDRGKVSTVERVLPNTGKLLADKVNVVKKHKKPTQNEKRGGIIEMEKPLNVSNVMVVCPNCNKPTRVSYSINNKSKERVCKKCKGSLDKTLSQTYGKNLSTKLGVKERK
ncbi:50S ribosomal protein L24 [bacterium (Candidatus Howlettbacteria) CG_4_10_14_0_8_um_filter_40_9]|nr:MAG: 50S ribosomal protein L24 [bacterium (Candidatus Howlettbacteria) CG_4_10_14_0_8_um_filter_40_9]